MHLENKVAVVTGGGSGIGLAIAEMLSGEGCRVVLAGRTAERLHAAAEWKQAARPETYPVDVADRQGVQQLFEWVRTRLGPVEILVNSAGVNITSRSMKEMTPAQWDHVLAVNVTGAYNCIHAVLPAMRARQSGIIVNISSVAGKRVTVLGGVAYCASKFAMTALGTGVGIEEAERGIRVTNVYPGEVDTPLLSQRAEPVSEQRRAIMLQPADVARMVQAIVRLPARAHVPELVIKPTVQPYS